MNIGSQSILLGLMFHHTTVKSTTQTNNVTSRQLAP